MSHDPCIYPDPFTFNPERFLGPNPEPDPHNIAFGFGLRYATHPFASPAEKNLEETDQLALVSTLPYFLTENLRGLQRVTHSQAISTFLEKADKGWQKSPMQWIIEIEKTKRENREGT